MKVKIVYPEFQKRSYVFNRLQGILTIVFAVAAVVCLTVNLAVGGRLWSLVVLWSLWGVWKMVISYDLVEFNIISQTVKTLFYVVVLLFLIDHFLAPGWAAFVIPIVCFATQIFLIIIYFIDVRKQTRNSLPMFWLALVSLIAIMAVWFFLNGINWPMIVVGSLSVVMVLIAFFAYRHEFAHELRKWFHTR